LIFEVRGLPKSKEFHSNGWNQNMPDYHGARIGVVVDCEEGKMVIPTYDSAIAYDKDGKEIKRWKRGADHYANFIAAMRSRDPGDLTAEILEGHLSSALCHAGNVSHLLGSGLPPEGIREKLQDNKAAQETFDRMAEHLVANGVDLAKHPAVLGEYLKMNVKTERFVGNKKANQLLTREYRKGFEVPEKV
jgi:hypothetical protein